MQFVRLRLRYPFLIGFDVCTTMKFVLCVADVHKLREVGGRRPCSELLASVDTWINQPSNESWTLWRFTDRWLDLRL